MEWDAAFSAIKTRVTTNWTALHPSIPLVWPNVPRPTFEDSPVVLHVEVRAGAANTRSFGGIGQNRQRQSGEVIFRLFAQSGIGTDNTAIGKTNINALTKDIAGLLRGWQNGDLRFFTAAPVGDAALQEDGNLYESTVIVSFMLDSFF